MAGYDDLVASKSFPVAPAGYKSNSDAVGVGQGLGLLLSGMVNDPNNDPKKAQARLYNSEAALKESQLTGQSVLSDAVVEATQLIKNNPGAAGEAIYKTGVKYGVKPKDLAELMMGLAGSQGADNNTMTNLRSGAGLSPLNQNESLTEERQNTIRDENFQQQQDMQTLKNNAPAKAPGVTFNDMPKIEDFIAGQTRDKNFSPEGASVLKQRVIDNYKKGMDPNSSLVDAMQSAVVPQKSSRMFGILPDKTTYVPNMVQPPDGSAATSAAPAVANGNSPAAVAAPLPAQREVGKIYMTPRGAMMWTGTGWKPGA